MWAPWASVPCGGGAGAPPLAGPALVARVGPVRKRRRPLGGLARRRLGREVPRRPWGPFGHRMVAGGVRGVTRCWLGGEVPHFFQPHSTTPHPAQVVVSTWLPDALGCCPSPAGYQWAAGSTFLGLRSHVNQCVLRPLTRGPGGQPSPLWTPQGRLGVQDIFRTPCGQAPHASPMVHLSMGTAFPIPTGCCLVLSVAHVTLHCSVRNPAMQCSPLPHPVPGPIPSSRSSTYLACLYPTGPPGTLWRGPEGPFCAHCTGCPDSTLLLLARTLLVGVWSFDCVPNPLGCQQPCGAGPKDRCMLTHE